MTVKKLSPKKSDPKPVKEDLELIEKFISGGGKTTEESRRGEPDEDSLSRFTVRMPPGLVKMIDDHRKGMIGNVSRNNWILQAIAKRLKEDD